MTAENIHIACSVACILVKSCLIIAVIALMYLDFILSPHLSNSN